MKLRCFVMGAALAASFSGVYAQQQEKENPWFVGGQLGLSYARSHGGLGELLSPSGEISAGKYFSPLWGARLALSGWRGRAAGERGSGTSGFFYGAATVDGLLNLSQAFKRNPDRLFDVSLVAGAGYNRSYDGPNAGSFMGRAGLQGSFRLNKAMSLNVEAMANGVSDRWNGLDDHSIDTYFNVGFGLTCRLGTGYKCPTCVSTEYNNDFEYVNQKVNAQREEKVKQTVKVVHDTVLVKEPATKVVKGLRSHVSFELAKTAVASSQEINVLAVADYMKQYPDSKAVIIGYADTGTGTREINLRLARERAETVADMLANKFGIERDRMEVSSMQGDEQPFQINDWNRVVIITVD